MRRWLLAFIAILFVLIQYRLWIGDNSLAERTRLEAQIEAQRLEIERLKARNQIVEREVQALRDGTGEIEARAREELGLIKEGETFYLVPDGEEPEVGEEP